MVNLQSTTQMQSHETSQEELISGLKLKGKLLMCTGIRKARMESWQMGQRQLSRYREELKKEWDREVPVVIQRVCVGGLSKMKVKK